MIFLKRKLGRKTDGDCLGIGRGSTLVRLRRRQGVIQLGTSVFLLRNHRNRQIRMWILSNVNEYDDISQDSHGTLSPKIVQLQSLATSLIDQHLDLCFVKTSSLQSSARQVSTAPRKSLCPSVSAPPHLLLEIERISHTLLYLSGTPLCHPCVSHLPYAMLCLKLSSLFNSDPTHLSPHQLPH